MPSISDLETIFRTHADGLAGAVRGVLGPRADAAEVLQEAFLKAWKSWDHKEPPRDPVAWVFVLTLNLARDHRRKALRRGPHLELEEVDDAEMFSTDRPEAMLARGETLAAARAAILALPEEQKEVFLMRTSGELSFSAVAHALGIPIGTAKSRMRSALASLRGRLMTFAPEAELEGDLR